MSVEVRVPTVLSKHTKDQRVVQADGSSVREVIESLDKLHPGFKSQVVSEEGELHRFINLYLNDEDVRYLQALDTKVSDGDVVAILPAVAGG